MKYTPASWHFELTNFLHSHFSKYIRRILVVFWPSIVLLIRSPAINLQNFINDGAVSQHKFGAVFFNTELLFPLYYFKSVVIHIWWRCIVLIFSSSMIVKFPVSIIPHSLWNLFVSKCYFHAIMLRKKCHFRLSVIVIGFIILTSGKNWILILTFLRGYFRTYFKSVK